MKTKKNITTTTTTMKFKKIFLFDFKDHCS